MAKREMAVSLTDIEIAGLLVQVEGNLATYAQVLEPEGKAKAEALERKLNVALKQFSDPKVTDVIDLYSGELELLSEALNARFEEMKYQEGGCDEEKLERIRRLAIRIEDLIQGNAPF